MCELSLALIDLIENIEYVLVSDIQNVRDLSVAISFLREISDHLGLGIESAQLLLDLLLELDRSISLLGLERSEDID